MKIPKPKQKKIESDQEDQDKHKSEDSDEDGLDYWANSDGVGYVKLRNVPGSWFSNFNADFGTNIIHNFRVGTILSSVNRLNKLSIFPNPATDNIRLESTCLIHSEIKILNLFGEKIPVECTLTPVRASSAAIRVEAQYAYGLMNKQFY